VTHRAETGTPDPAASGAGATLRLDKWLWHARFFKSRSQAASFCGGGRVRLNRRPIEKASAAVRVGDVLTFAHASGIRVVRVRALGARRGPPAEAKALYDDLVAPDVPAQRARPDASVHSPIDS
jgi:ribosome-associated heat shock protein Hsp15